MPMAPRGARETTSRGRARWVAVRDAVTWPLSFSPAGAQRDSDGRYVIAFRAACGGAAPPLPVQLGPYWVHQRVAEPSADESTGIAPPEIHGEGLSRPVIAKTELRLQFKSHTQRQRPFREPAQIVLCIAVEPRYRRGTTIFVGETQA